MQLEEEGVWRAGVAGSWLPPELWNLKVPQQEGRPGSWALTPPLRPQALLQPGGGSRVCHLAAATGFCVDAGTAAAFGGQSPGAYPDAAFKFFFLGGTVLFVGAGVAVPLSLLPFFPPAAGSAIMAGPGQGTALPVAVSVSSVFQATHLLRYRYVISQRPGVWAAEPF